MEERPECQCDGNQGCNCDGGKTGCNCEEDNTRTTPENSKKGIEKLAINNFSSVKKVIAIMSGKGGVGKSSVTSLLASGFRKRGFEVGVLDAVLPVPVCREMFGIKGMAEGPPSVCCRQRAPAGQSNVH